MNSRLKSRIACLSVIPEMKSQTHLSTGSSFVILTNSSGISSGRAVKCPKSIVTTPLARFSSALTVSL